MVLLAHKEENAAWLGVEKNYDFYQNLPQFPSSTRHFLCSFILELEGGQFDYPINWPIAEERLDCDIGVNVLMRQDNSHFRGTMNFMAEFIPLWDNSSVVETKDVVKWQ